MDGSAGLQDTTLTPDRSGLARQPACMGGGARAAVPGARTPRRRRYRGRDSREGGGEGGEEGEQIRPQVVSLQQRAKLGLGPSVPARARATPAAGGRAQHGTLRKRDLPTPCPTGGSTSKRPRVLGSRIPSGSASRSTSGTARSVSGCTVRSVSGASVRRVDETPTASAARRFGAPAGSRANALVPRQQERTDVFKTPGKTPGRAPRKSFKPRRSIAGGLLAGRFALDEADEDDDVF